MPLKATLSIAFLLLVFMINPQAGKSQVSVEWLEFNGSLTIIPVVNGCDSFNVDITVNEMSLLDTHLYNSAVFSADTLYLDMYYSSGPPTFPSTNFNIQSFRVGPPTPGEYKVIARAWVGTFLTGFHAPIDLSVDTLEPVFGFPSTGICDGETINFTNNTVGLGAGPTTYTWSENGVPFSNAVNPGLQLNGAGPRTINLAVTNGACAVDSSVVINVNANPVIALGPDTTSCGPMQLDAGTGFSSYQWSTNQNSPAITAPTTGSYSVLVIDSNGCEGTDTLMIDVLDIPTVELGQDTSICENDNLQLSVAATNATYTWQDNSTNQSFLVSDAGSFWVEVVGANGCTNTDTIQVALLALPPVGLGVDTAICENDNLQLTVQATNATYTWQDNSTDQSFLVSDAGSFWVEVIGTNGCINSDTIEVTTLDLPQVELGNDTQICVGQTLVLDATVTNGSYLWQDNSTASTFTVSNSGAYSVQVTGNNGCSQTDVINVTTVICSGIEERTAAKVLSLFPNPGKGTIYLKTEQPIQQVQVMNLQGQIYHTISGLLPTGIHTLDLSTAPAGIYLLQFRSANQLFTERLVIE